MPPPSCPKCPSHVISSYDCNFWKSHFFSFFLNNLLYHQISCHSSPSVWIEVPTNATELNATLPRRLWATTTCTEDLYKKTWRVAIRNILNIQTHYPGLFGKICLKYKLAWGHPNRWAQMMAAKRQSTVHKTTAGAPGNGFRRLWSVQNLHGYS